MIPLVAFRAVVDHVPVQIQKTVVPAAAIGAVANAFRELGKNVSEEEAGTRKHHLPRRDGTDVLEREHRDGPLERRYGPTACLVR